MACALAEVGLRVAPAPPLAAALVDTPALYPASTLEEEVGLEGYEVILESMMVLK